MTLEHLDSATRDSVIARRNFLVGVWAGRQLGHRDEELAIYAGRVMASDLDEPGPQDVIAKVFGDLKGGGIELTRNCVVRQLRQTEKSVRDELIMTD